MPINLWKRSESVHISDEWTDINLQVMIPSPLMPQSPFENDFSKI